MYTSRMNEETITQLEQNLLQRRMQAAAFSCICLFLTIMAVATLVRIPEFVAAQESGKVLGSLAFTTIVALCSADNVRTHIFLWRWLRMVGSQKRQAQWPDESKPLIV